jgi:hypothetical protein
MKYLFILLFLAIPLSVFSQLDRFAGGLSFSDGIIINGMETGNPGVLGKVYFKLFDKAYLTPGLTIFYPKKYDDQVVRTRNYMFHADIDFHYAIVREREIQLIAFGGINATSAFSKNKQIHSGFLVDIPEDKSIIIPGINMGACIEMMVNNNYDAMIFGKYIAGEIDQFVIQIGVAYYVKGKRRRIR